MDTNNKTIAFIIPGFQKSVDPCNFDTHSVFYTL